MKLNMIFLRHFEDRYTSNHVFRPNLVLDSFKKLSSEKIGLLDALVSYDEIQAAVWDCGSDKASSLDGFFFSFIKSIGV